MAHLQTTGRPASHGIPNSSSTTDTYHTPRTQHWRQPLQSLDGNAFLLPTPGPLESMLRKTTETGDIGLFSIGPVCYPTNFSFPFRQNTRWSRSTCTRSSPRNGWDTSISRDDRRWLPSYRDSTCEIISMYGSGSLSSGSELFTPLSDRSERRSYSMTTCSSGRLTAQKSDEKYSESPDYAASRAPAISTSLLATATRASSHIDVQGLGSAFPRSVGTHFKAASYGSTGTLRDTLCHTPNDKERSKSPCDQPIPFVPLQDVAIDPHQGLSDSRGHKRNLAVPKINISALSASKARMPMGPNDDPIESPMSSQFEADEAKNEGAVTPTAPREREAGLEVTLSQRLTSRCEIFSSGPVADAPHTPLWGLPAEECTIVKFSRSRLKLKVFRGALAKAQRRSGDVPRVSLDRKIECGAWGEGLDDFNWEDGFTGSGMAAPPAAHLPSRRWGQYLDRTSSVVRRLAVSSTQDKSAEIQSLFPGDGPISSKVVRRLKRRFPDLRDLLAEAQLQSTESLTAKRAEVGRAGQVKATPSLDQSQQLCPKRLKARISRWVRSAKQSIKGAVGTRRRG